MNWEVPLFFMHRSLQRESKLSTNAIDEDQFLSSFIFLWKPSRLSFQKATSDATFSIHMVMGYITMTMKTNWFLVTITQNYWTKLFSIWTGSFSPCAAVENVKTIFDVQEFRRAYRPQRITLVNDYQRVVRTTHALQPQTGSVLIRREIQSGKSELTSRHTIKAPHKSWKG